MGPIEESSDSTQHIPNFANATRAGGWPGGGLRNGLVLRAGFVCEVCHRGRRPQTSGTGGVVSALALDAGRRGRWRQAAL